jgi:hypothetical protein
MAASRHNFSFPPGGLPNLDLVEVGMLGSLAIQR